MKNTHLSILDIEWNNAIEMAAKKADEYSKDLRGMGADEHDWVWNAAKSMTYLAEYIRVLKKI